jgi:hypothetical protein
MCQYLEKEDLELIIEAPRIIDDEMDDILDKVLEGDILHTAVLVVDGAETCAHLQELLIEEALELLAQHEVVDEALVLVVEVGVEVLTPGVVGFEFLLLEHAEDLHVDLRGFRYFLEDLLYQDILDLH